MLAAFNDNPLSPEAAAQLLRMVSDPNTPMQDGRELKPISEEELVRLLRTAGNE